MRHLSPEYGAARPPSRRFNWISSSEAPYELRQFQAEMARFYAENPRYYDDVDFTKDNWRDDEAYRFIGRILADRSAVLEVGCGRANVLRHYPRLEGSYTGVDFSSTLMRANQESFPKAHFIGLRDANSFPFRDREFDCVYSTFVLEHCVFPSAFLDECWRSLKSGGVLLVLCPDMLGRSRMTSQQLGFSIGTGRQKLRSRQWADALVTAWDTRVRMVLATWLRRLSARKRPKFYINTSPLCLTQQFQPDFDAVYLTFRDEIVHYLRDRFRWIDLPREVARHCDSHGLILLHGVRSGAEEGSVVAQGA